jgi:hypothetical protein
VTSSLYGLGRGLSKPAKSTVGKQNIEKRIEHLSATRTGYASQMLVRIVPIIAGLLPIVVVATSYVISVSVGKVPACIPLLSGCTSISATGRYPPASYLFKAGMLPEAVLLALYWILSVAWLRSLERSAGGRGTGGIMVGTLGVAGSFFLILYVTFLGSHEPFYEFMRRFGIYLYFFFTIIAQAMLAWAVINLANTRSLLLRIARIQLVLALLPLALGALNLVLKSVLADADDVENIIEWIVALQMQLYVMMSFFAWRQTGFSAKFDVSR